MSYVRAAQPAQEQLPAGARPARASGSNGNGYIRALNQALAAAYTYNVSPTELAEFRLGVSRTIAGK